MVVLCMAHVFIVEYLVDNIDEIIGRVLNDRHTLFERLAKVDIATPDNETLKKIAEQNPPPKEWLDSDEECPF